MNRLNDKGHYLFVLRSYFYGLNLKGLFKRFIQNVALTFPKKQIQAMKNVDEGVHFTVVLNINKEELLHRNFRRALPAYL